MTDSIAIDIKGLTKSFSNGWLGKKQVLNDLNFQIRDNEVFGYLGGNGAGKTTTFKLMLGLIRPDKGEISFWGCSAKDRISRAMIGYLPEQPYFYAYLTGAEALDFYASLFDMTGAERKKRVGYLLDLVGLTHAGDTQLRNFSRGMLQRIGIAQALVNDPKLLILDEPMSGLDPMGRKAVRDIILSCRYQGKTIILSKPLARWQFLMGKYLGLSLTILVEVAVMTILLFALCFVYEKIMPWSLLTAIVPIYIEILVILAFAVFFSAFSSPFLSGMFTLAIFIIGHFTQDLRLLAKASEDTVFKALADGAYYILPNLERLNYKTRVVHDLVIPGQELGLSFVYAVSYIAVVLITAVFIFENKDIS